MLLLRDGAALAQVEAALARVEAALARIDAVVARPKLSFSSFKNPLITLKW